MEREAADAAADADAAAMADNWEDVRALGCLAPPARNGRITILRPDQQSGHH